MSQENVDLVIALQRPGVDVAQLFRDDSLWAEASAAASYVLHPGFESAAHGLPGGDVTYPGFDGFRNLFLDWYAPWATYRQEIEEIIDLGERVLLLTNYYGRLDDSAAEVKFIGADLWTVREGKVVCYDAYANRAEALKAVGLEG